MHKFDTRNWISNNDPPLYVWTGDTWFNQKDKKLYISNTEKREWNCQEHVIPFPKKTMVMQQRKNHERT